MYSFVLVHGMLGPFLVIMAGAYTCMQSKGTANVTPYQHTAKPGKNCERTK